MASSAADYCIFISISASTNDARWMKLCMSDKNDFCEWAIRRLLTQEHREDSRSALRISSILNGGVRRVLFVVAPWHTHTCRLPPSNTCCRHAQWVGTVVSCLSKLWCHISVTSYWKTVRSRQILGQTWKKKMKMAKKDCKKSTKKRKSSKGLKQGVTGDWNHKQDKYGWLYGLNTIHMIQILW